MLNQYADTMVEKMKQNPLFLDPDNSVEIGTPEIRVVIDRTKAADLGVRAGDVAQALNTLAAGQIVSTFSKGSRQYDVIVRADEPFRRDRNNFKFFTVASSNGGTVGLDRVVKLEQGMAPSAINRLNRQRQVSVTSGLPPNTSEADALATIQQFARDLQMPPEYSTA